jgi:AcrR family transcriptional regulator
MRKAPRQARARATTEAILDAAAHILGERGWAGLTTNTVAEVAGVSIGSLYQYYPNKLALIEAVRARHFDEVLAVLRAGSDEAAPRDHRISALVDGMIAIHSRYPAAHRVLLEESPRESGIHDAFDRECRAAYETIVKANCDRKVDLRVAGHALAGALAGAVHEAAEQGSLRSTRFRQELIHLVTSYFSRASSVRATRKPAP